MIEREKRLQRVTDNPDPTQSRRSLARIRTALAELGDMHLGNINMALERLFITDPEKALTAYIRLLEFSTPKLSRSEIDVKDDRKVASLSIADLEEMIARRGVPKMVGSKVIDGSYEDVSDLIE